jgi:hypothetical protein
MGAGAGSGAGAGTVWAMDGAAISSDAVNNAVRNIEISSGPVIQANPALSSRFRSRFDC